LRRWLIPIALLAAATAAGPMSAQEKKDDALAKALFDPELVIRHARDVGLSPQQRQAILEAVKKVQTELVPLQLDMAEPAMDLLEILQENQVDEAAAIAKADRVLKIENEVKKKQMALLIRIKNLLTKDQQDRLRAFRDRGGDGAGDAPALGPKEEEERS